MPLRVATLNIWNRMEPWEKRLITIRSELAKLDADIIALQEVVQVKPASAMGDLDASPEFGFDQARIIADGLDYTTCFGRNVESPYPMGIALLSRWPILRTLDFPLPRVETDEHRSLLFAEIKAPFGSLHVFCTHLNWKLDEGHVREAQIRYITDQVRGLAQPNGYPAILMGDFNAEPDSDEIRFLRGRTSLGGTSVYFSDAFAIAGDGSSGATFCRSNPFAAPAREPDRRIDYIFVQGPDDQGRGEPLDARLCFQEPYEGTFASDHFGVIATLRVTPDDA
ncbi:endonuclease/exonuclease/phosphatase family protein [Pendulispora albinea]|uniref:Endonuclease/exonuclease/phosphatase family protein n=1 Tax=Pendulispora albinea TaxID=2741071 RepID=A0ABZ2LYH1_9BACT